MKTPWIIPFVLCVACDSHQPAEQKKDTAPDTPGVVSHIIADTPTVAPVEEGKDTTASLPGKTLVFTTDLNYDSIPDTISLRTLARDTLAYDSITVSIAHHGRQSFIRISNNTPRLVFDQRHWADNFIEVVNVIKDMDGDGRFEFGYGHLTEPLNDPTVTGGVITAYCPTKVYTVADSLVLNKPMTKKFNEANYVFAGYEYSDAVKVFHPDDRTKKCRIWKK